MVTISQHDSKRFRRSILGMAAIALAAYLVAFAQADRGTVLYEQYAVAFKACQLQLLEVGALQTDCHERDNVRYYLSQHREAFAVGEPFLNLALSLTLAILLSPLLRKITLLGLGFFSTFGSGSHRHSS